MLSKKLYSLYVKIKRKYLILKRGKQKLYSNWSKIIRNDEIESLLLLDIIPLDIVNVNTSKLNMHTIQDVAFIESKSVADLLADSPHVELLESYNTKKTEDFYSNCMNLPYCKQLASSDFKYNYYNGEVISRSLTESQIISRVKSFILLFESIKKNGYMKGEFANRIICILEKPFWNTRYGSQLQSSNNFEIFIGHHRAAALYVLGYRDIKVVLLRDDHGNSMTIENHFKFL